MKTLKWSSFVVFSLCIFSSCTKSTNNETELSTAARVGTGGNGIGNTVQPDPINPGLSVTFNPSPAVENETAIVTGGFDGTTAVPDCGKLQLFQKINGDWIKVSDADVTSTIHQVVFEFTPTIVGEDVYEFRVHFISAGCSGFSQTFSGSFFLDVIADCHGLSITGTASAVPDIQTGFYLFTVNYTVSTCGVQYTHLKTQGGLTAFSNQVQVITPGYDIWEVGNSTHPNTIIKWEESSSLSGNSKTYTTTFKKAWSGSGPVQITGQWSVSADVNGTESAVATFAPIYYN
jgi:hypothetical protein